MNLRATLNRALSALRFRGHGLVTKSIQGIEKTVIQLENGVKHIEQDIIDSNTRLEAYRRKHFTRQAVLYAEQDVLRSAKARAERVADRWKELVK